MSRTIDERVLQMEFDNKRFEKGAQESIATLEKLNKSCQLEGASNGISGLQQAIDNINSHFTIMGRLSERVMDTIVDKVQSTVSQITHLTKSLTVDQISSGFEKYESITASTQTIMGALSEADKKIISERGMENIDYVTEQIGRMNQYTDETSYNLTDMTSNVGKFMSAGVDLQSAVSAMEGIANWAARSGANVQQASHAMYNLSQAMGTGYVQLMDWKSIENASMATKEFKEQVIATAKSMGTIDDSVTKKAGEITAENFNSTLQYKWFTSDVLMQTLEDYNEFYNQILKLQETEEGSAMTVTQIIGELQDNTELGAKWIKEYGIDLNSLSAQSFLAAQEYKSFSDVISATSDAISTSWMNIFQDIFGNLEESKDLWSRVGDDFYDTFAQPISDLQTVMGQWKDMGGRNVLLEAFDNLREAVDSIVSPIKQAFADIFGEFSSEKGAAGAASKLLVFTQNLRDFTKQMIISDDAGQGLRATFREIFRVIDIGLGVFKDLVNIGIKVVKFFADVAEGLFGFVNGLETGEGYLDSFNKCGDSMSAVLEAIGDSFTHLTTKLSKIPVLGKLVTWGQQVVSFIGGTLKQWIDWLLVKFEDLTGIHLEFKIPSAKQIVKTLTDIGTAAKNLWDVFSNGFDSSTPIKFLESIGNGLLAVYDEIKKFVDKKYTEFMAKDGYLQQFFKWIGGVKDTSAEGLQKTGESLKKFGEDTKAFFEGVNWKMVGEIGITSALAVLIVKFKKQIDKIMGLGKDLKKTFTDTFTAPFKSFAKAMNAAATDMKADALVKAAEAIAILAVSLTLLGRLDADQLARCTVSLLALMLGLSKLINSKNSSDMAKGMKSLSSLKDILSDFAEGVVGALKNVAIAALITSFVVALTALAVALRLYAGIEWETLGKAGAVLLSLIVAFAALTGIVGAMQNLKATNLLALASVILVLAPSLGMLASAAKKFEEIKDVSTLQNAIGAVTAMISVLLLAVAASNKLNGSGQNSLKGVSAAILSLTGAVLLLGTLNTISSSGIAGMTAMIFNMVLAMASLVGAAVAINKMKLQKTIGKIIGAMKQLSNLAYSMTTFNLSMAALIAIFSIFPDGIAKVATSIYKNAKVIAVAVVEVFTMVLTALAAYKFKYVAGMLSFIVTVVEMVKDQSDQIITPLMEILGDVLMAVADFIDSAVDYVIPALVRVINSIADAIRNNSKPILSAIGNLWDAAVSLVSEGIAGFTGLDLDFVTDLVDFAGKAGIIVAGISKISKALGGLSGTTKGTKTSGNFLTDSLKAIVSSPANIVNNVKAMGTIFTSFQKGIAANGVAIFGLGNKISGKAGLVGQIGSLIEKVGLGTITFAKFLPQIALAAAAIGGVIAAVKLGLSTTENAREEMYGVNTVHQNLVDNLKNTAQAIDEVCESSDKELATIQSKYDAYDLLAKQYDSLEDKSSSDGTDILKQLSGGLDITLEDLDTLIQKYGSAEEAMRNYYTKQRAEEYLSTLQTKKQSITEELSGTLEDRQKLVQEYDKSVSELEDLNQSYERLIRTVADNHATTYTKAKEMLENNQGLEAFEESERNDIKDAIGRKLNDINTLKTQINEYSDIIAELNETNNMINSLQGELTGLETSQTEEEMQAHRDNINTLLSSIKLSQEDIVEAGKATAEVLEEQTQTALSAFDTMYDSYTRGVFSDEELSDQISKLTDALKQGGAYAKAALQESIDDATDIGDTNLASILQGVYDSLSSDTEELTKLGTEAGETVKTSFLENMLSAISTESMSTNDILSAFEQQMGAADFSKVFGNSGAQIVEGLKTSIANSGISSVMDIIDTDGLASAANVKLEEVVNKVSGGNGVTQNLIKAPVEVEIKADSTKVAQSLQTSVDTAIDSINTDASPKGKELDESFASDITANSDVAKTAAEGVGNNAKSGLEVDTTSSGVNFLSGFARGLSSLSGAIGSKCYQLGKSFVAKFNKGLDEHSPSKATAKSGVFFLKGFVNGIRSYNSTANKAVMDSAEDMVASFSDSLAYINGIVTDNLDVNPRITPVLDLSQVQNGSAELASMLGMSQTYQTAAAVASGFTSPAQMQTDSINQSMSSAMADLIASQQEQAKDQTFTFNIPLDVNGRQIAKATRTYTQNELNNLNTIMNRKGGVRG